jgi:hypothetical protein
MTCKAHLSRTILSNSSTYHLCSSMIPSHVSVQRRILLLMRRDMVGSGA